MIHGQSATSLIRILGSFSFRKDPRIIYVWIQREYVQFPCSRHDVQQKMTIQSLTTHITASRVVSPASRSIATRIDSANFYRRTMRLAHEGTPAMMFLLSHTNTAPFQTQFWLRNAEKGILFTAQHLALHNACTFLISNDAANPVHMAGVLAQHGWLHRGQCLPGRTHCSMPRSAQRGHRTPGIGIWVWGPPHDAPWTTIPRR